MKGSQCLTLPASTKTTSSAVPSNNPADSHNHEIGAVHRLRNRDGGVATKATPSASCAITRAWSAPGRACSLSDSPVQKIACRVRCTCALADEHSGTRRRRLPGLWWALLTPCAGPCRPTPYLGRGFRISGPGATLRLSKNMTRRRVPVPKFPTHMLGVALCVLLPLAAAGK